MILVQLRIGERQAKNAPIVLMLITTIIIIIMVRVITPQVELQVVENLQAAQSLLFTAGHLL